MIGMLGCWEPLITGVFQKIVKKGGIVIDVGASIGWYTLLSWQLVGPTGRVVTFEPEPLNFSLLTKSLAQNKLPNTDAFQCAVSDRDGMVSLYLSQEPGLHSIKWDSGNLAIDVKSVRLDTVIENLAISRINLVKIDVEGAEPEVIKGAERSISLGRIDSMIMEWNPSSWDENRQTLDMLSKSYAIYWIPHSFPFFPLLRFQRISLDAIPKITGNLYLRKNV